jgi:hypothetical protein
VPWRYRDGISIVLLPDPTDDAGLGTDEERIAPHDPASASGEHVSMCRPIWAKMECDVPVQPPRSRLALAEHSHAYARRVIADDWPTVKGELRGTAELTERDGRPLIVDRRTVPELDKPEIREQAYEWLAERVNTFVNVLRPRVRSAASDYELHPE